MASTYSPNLRVELIGTGDQAGTWGTTTNNNLGTLLENAISGYEAVSVTAANQALTALNGIDDQARNLMLNFSTTTGADFAVYAPPSPKVYVVKNSSAYTVSVYNSSVFGNTTAAGTGVAIPSGKTISIWSDGTNMAAQITHLPALTLTSDLAVADGGTGASTAADARTNLGVTATGADTTYAFRANNLSDLASASSARTNLGLGTIATQNSSSVSITGGSISGITDIAIADGGTGSSTASGARSNLGVTATGSDTTYAFRSNNLSDLSNISTARSNLGLGTLATLSSINDGNWSGTDLSVANGGTGASDAATARTNLSVPSTTGSGASGTWAISISGNAATATSATSATNATTATTLQTTRTIGGVGFNGSADINLPGVNIAGNQNTSGNAATASSVAYTNVTGRPPVGWKQVFSGVVVGATTAPTQFFRTWRILFNSGVNAREMVSPDSFMVTTSLNDLYTTSGTSESIYSLRKEVGIVYPTVETKFYLTWIFGSYPVPNNINVVIYVADTTAVHSLTVF